MAENETGAVMLPPAKTQEAFVRIGFAKARLMRGRAFVLAILAGAFVALGASFMLMVRKWAVVYAGSAVGALLAAALLLASGFLSMQEGSVGGLSYAVAHSKASLDPATAFARGILCNVLVCLGVWMGSAGKTACDKLAATILPVVSFVVLGFEHSVANMLFLLLGVAAQSMLGSGAIPLAGMVSNLMFVTLGNIVGGAAVAAAYWFVYGRDVRE